MAGLLGALARLVAAISDSFLLDHGSIPLPGRCGHDRVRRRCRVAVQTLFQALS
jgi:hypothetical protein